MNRTGQDLAVTKFPDDGPSMNGLIISSGGGRAEEIISQATTSINDVLQTTTAQIKGSFEQLKETIKGCEAKISASEEIQVIVKADQMIFSIKRSFEVLKDK